jgi:replicative DNA helicase
MATNAMKSDHGIVGVPTGLNELDERLGGLHRSDLVIIAGRPSMGKTALATNIGYYAAKKILDDNKKSSIAFFLWKCHQNNYQQEFYLNNLE